MRNPCVARDRAHTPFAGRLARSCALTAGLMGLALSLGAGALTAADDHGFEARKQQMLDRMLEIGQQAGDLRKHAGAAAERSREMQQLLNEYRSLSAALGGDDPAHLIGSAPAGGNSAPLGDEGAIASAPAAPAGCVATTTAFANATPTLIPVVPNALTSSQILVSGVNPVLWDLNVTTFITHTAPGDMQMTLTSPAGTVVTLSSSNAGSADNVFNGTAWDDDANPSGQVPYANNAGMVTDRAYANNVVANPLTPEEPFGAFIGENPNGTWTLNIVDTLQADSGSLVSWAMQVTTVAAAPTTSTAAPSNPTPVAIPTGPAEVTSTILVAGQQSVLTDVNLTTFITHSNCEDLDITLTSPAGTIVTLTTDNGSVFDNVYNGTVWDDDANPAGVAPYTTNNGMVTDHAYANNVLASPLTPEEPLAAFIGENPNGTWTLKISDDSAANAGNLASWSLGLTTTSAAPATSVNVFNNNTVTPVDPPLVVTSIINVAGAGASLWDVDVTTALTHSANGDVNMTLTSPAGTVVTLTTGNGATLDNIYNGTLWDDDANPAGAVPYLNNNGVATDQTYANNTTATPLVCEEALGAFAGENPNGNWTLTIHDALRATDGGSLASWNLSLTTIAAAPVNDSPIAVSNTTSQPITAASPTLVSSTIPVAGAVNSICDVNVTMNISHTFCGDLDVTLTSPAGTVVTLTTDNGGGNDNVFAGTTFDDDANPAGPLPYASNNGLATDRAYADLVVATPLVPEEAMAAFIGENPNGTWTLNISDDTTGNGGTLNSWSLQIITCKCDGVTPCEGDTNASGAVDVDDLITVILQWGCANPPGPCSADVNGSGVVDVDDLITVILHWGVCP